MSSVEVTGCGPVPGTVTLAVRPCRCDGLRQQQVLALPPRVAVLRAVIEFQG